LKILLVSDLHYTLKQLDWLRTVADQFDLIVIPGDLLDIASTVPINAQVVVVLKYLRELNQRTRLLVTSGNHDLDATDDAGEKTAAWMDRVRRIGISCDDGCITIGDTLISLCRWWDGPESCRRVGAQLARDSERRLGRWYWLYHAPPDVSPTSWGGKRHFGDVELRGWIEQYQPDMVFCGHIHQTPFKPEGSWCDRIGESWVFNPGRQIGPIPTQIVIDTGSQQAIWMSLAGTQIVELDRPLQRPLRELE